ncbi:MAG: hypothetical protein K1X88_04410 [Nannocystaceae bacterium]|nr:hypothetical protein [Nannocystaceae bacterium]
MDDGKRGWRALVGGNAWRSMVAALVCVVGLAVFAATVNRHYPLRDWLLWRVGLLWIYIALWLAACVGMGRFVLRKLLRERELPLAETWLQSMAVGLVAFVLCLYAAGTVGAFHPAVAIGLPALFVAFSQRDLRALLRRSRDELGAPIEQSTGMAWLRRAAAVWCVIGFAIVYVIAFSPEAISLDAAWYHLPIAHDYVRAGRIIPFYSEYNRTLPHLSSMMYTWGFLLPGVHNPFEWMMALHLEFVMLAWRTVAVAACAQWMLGDRNVRGLWASVMLFPLMFAFAHSVTAGAEHFLGFWAVPVLLATMRMLDRFDTPSCVLLGLVSGGSILTKYQAIYMITACGILVVGRWLWLMAKVVRKQPEVSARALWLAPLTVMCVGLGVASPHFVKNYLFYGDPMYPFLMGKLSSAFPNNPEAATLFSSNLGDPDNRPTAKGLARLTDAVANFFSFSFRPHYVVVKQKWPLFGSLFTLLTPAVVVLKGARRIWVGIFCCFITILVWTNTYLQDRYLNAVVAVFIATTVVMIVRLWELGRLARIALVPLVGFQVAWGLDTMTWSGDTLIKDTIEFVRSGYRGETDPSERYPWRKDFRAITAATPPDAKLLVRGTREVLGLDREVHRDVQWHQAYFYYAGLRNTAELQQYYVDKGLTHLVWQPRVGHAGTLHSTILFTALVKSSPVKPESFGPWRLLPLPPPPADAPTPMLVAITGLQRIYPAGLFHVDDLMLYSGKLDGGRGGPIAPREKLGKGESFDKFFSRAHAVVLGEGAKLSPEVQRALDQGFVKVEEIDDVRIFLRR